VLAEGWQAVGAQRVGVGPGPRGVDDRAGLDVVLRAVAGADAHNEGELVVAGATELVDVLAGDPDHLVAQPQAGGERWRGGQGIQVAAQQLVAGGQRLVGSSRWGPGGAAPPDPGPGTRG
jgi:hypothetical protein